MRLLVVSTWFPHPPDNGSRIRALNLLQELARRHRVSLLAFADSGDPCATAPFDALCEHVAIVRWPVSRSAPLGMRGLLSPVPRAYVQRHSREMAARVRQQIDAHDAAIAMEIDAAPYVATLGVPRVLDGLEVGAYVDRIRLAPTAAARLRAHLTWAKARHYVRRLAARFDHTTTVSAPERDHLLAIGCEPARISIVPNGVTVPADPPTPRARGTVLVYPGAVSYDANADAVRYFGRDVLPRVRRVRPDVQLVVTGATGGRERELAVEGITFTGPLDDVTPLLREAAACVVPLRLGGGTRLKVLHALACGTPVVSTSKGIEGLDLVVGRDVLVGDTPEAFAAQIVRVLGDASVSEALSRQGAAAVRRGYTWEIAGRALESALEAAVASRQSHAEPFRGAAGG